MQNDPTALIFLFWVSIKTIHLITNFSRWFNIIKIWNIMNISNDYSSPKTTYRPVTTENEKDAWLWAVILIGIIVFIVSFSSLMRYLYRKRRSKLFLIMHSVSIYYILRNKYRTFAYLIQMTSQNSYQPPGLIQVISSRADTDP